MCNKRVFNLCSSHGLGFEHTVALGTPLLILLAFALKPLSEAVRVEEMFAGRDSHDVLALVKLLDANDAVTLVRILEHLRVFCVMLILDLVKELPLVLLLDHL